jgi:hypothetical protein
MKNKDLIKKLQELDPEMEVVVNAMEDFNMLKNIEIRTTGDCVGKGDSIADMRGYNHDIKMIVLSDGY